MQKVTIEIVNGVPTIRVDGVRGKGCTALTAELEKALGGTSKTEPTAEYNQLDTSLTITRKQGS